MDPPARLTDFPVCPQISHDFYGFGIHNTVDPTTVIIKPKEIIFIAENKPDAYPILLSTLGCELECPPGCAVVCASMIQRIRVERDLPWLIPRSVWDERPTYPLINAAQCRWNMLRAKF
jgi:hypothetical protein